MIQLSILIPSRNEPYLQRTINDIFEHAETDIEVLFEEDTGLGQRGLTNKLARKAKGKYVMKVDAHCSFGQGFDRILLEDMQDDMIVAPTLLGLNAEKWQPIPKPISSAYCFDRDFVFQYNREAENSEPLNETMCLQGSAWMIAKDKYFAWNVCDESYGSWGSQAVELGIQAFINGGRCVTNKKTYYAHLFRESDADFPYERDKPQMRRAHNLIKERFEHDPRIQELVEKFDRPSNWKNMV